MKLAWFTSFSKSSAIGQCSLSVLRALPSTVQVTLFASDIREPSEALSNEIEMELLCGANPDDVAQGMARFDAIIYNLGDHFPMHHRTYEVAIRVPGIVVLHDLVMHHFFSGLYLADHYDMPGYLAELQYAHGAAGRQAGEDILSGRLGSDVWNGPVMLDYHMAKSATRNCLGVVVHSQFAQHALEQLATAPVRNFSFPSPLKVIEPGRDQRRARGMPTHVFELVTFGVVNRNKMIDQVVRAIAHSDVLRRIVTYNIIGDYSHSKAYSDELESLIRESGLENTVHLLGRLSDEELHMYLQRADIVLNLRNPHFGESSWSLLESMFAGKATIVWKHGFYDEVPDETVAKVGSLGDLRKNLMRLTLDSEERTELGRRAAAYARHAFSARVYSRRLLEFHDEVRYGAPVLRLADFVATTLGELGANDPRVVERVSAEVAGIAGVSTA